MRDLQSFFTEAKRANCNLVKCGIDDHWRPYSVDCNYCDYAYDFIARFENFADDTKYIFETLNLTSLVPMSEIETKSNEVSGAKAEKEQRRRNYFRQLDNSTIESLIDMFKIDFEMFAYDPWSYIYPNK